MSEPCPTCGHVVDEGEHWRPTGEYRVQPTGERSPSGNLFKFRQQQLWARTWGEFEWRDA